MSIHKIIFALIVIATIIILSLTYIFGAVNTYNDTKYKTLSRMKANGCTRVINSYYYSPNIGLDAITYPCVMKPDVKSGCGYGVELIKDRFAAQQYIDTFDFSCNDNIIIQDYVAASNEIGVLIERDTINGPFKVISAITKTPINKDLPFDQRSTCSSNLTCNDITLTNAATSNILADINTLVSSNDIINVAKVDILFNNLTDLDTGNYHIIEVNGVFGYTDYSGNERYNFKHFMHSVRWIKQRMIFGLSNIVNGNANIFTNKQFRHGLINVWLIPRLHLITKIEGLNYV